MIRTERERYEAAPPPGHSFKKWIVWTIQMYEPRLFGPCQLRYLARGSRLPPGGRFRGRPLIASE